MDEQDARRGLLWACQAWVKAEQSEDRSKHAADAARLAGRLGLDAADLAALAFVDVEAAREILSMGGKHPGVIVEGMFLRWIGGDVQGALARLHDEVVIVSHSGETIRGLAALRSRMAAPEVPKPDFKMRLDHLEVSEGTVLAAGHASVVRGAHVEHHRPAWVCHVVDSRIVRVKTFLNWTEARVAAGFDQEPSRPERARDWLFARARLRAPRLAAG